jgi:hypothetical protein
VISREDYVPQMRFRDFAATAAPPTPPRVGPSRLATGQETPGGMTS